MSKGVRSGDSEIKNLRTAAYKRSMGETSGPAIVVTCRDELGR